MTELPKKKNLFPYDAEIAKCKEIQQIIETARSNLTHTPEASKAQLTIALKKIGELAEEVEKLKDSVYK